MVLMGSGAEAAEEAVEHLQAQGENVGVVKVRLFRPFSPESLVNALPPTVCRVAVLDRTKESGADGEPLYKDVLAAQAQDHLCGSRRFSKLPHVIGGRFGLSSMVANATGCSSIYGGNLPTTPWTRDRHGRGPAWSNSLFEDNAEFGFGMRIAVDKLAQYARELLQRLRPAVGGELPDAILAAGQSDAAGIDAQRGRIVELKERLDAVVDPDARSLAAVADFLIKRSVWIVGGDGWAYDIGYGGLDYVLASGRNVNILVLDTEVYSNTRGQTSKATPRAAVAKFSAGGEPTRKKDLARMAMDYEQVYVAKIAFGAKDTQTLRALLEAESYEGPSLIIAYCPCIAHGVDLSNNLHQQGLAVRSGHWPLLRCDPRRSEAGKNPLHLDSAEPSMPYRDFAATETRFSILWRTHPEAAERLLREAQADVEARYRFYRALATRPTESRAQTKEARRS